MRISVLEYNLASSGGRQQTMVSGFADCFAELGHEVHIYGNFLEGHIPSKDRLLDYHLASHLTVEDFDFGYDIGKNPDRMPIKEFSDGDILLIPYPAYSWLGEHVSCPIVSWCIADPGEWYPQHLARLWTNSHTQKKLLGLEEARVIYAPHDYSPFREQSQPWNKRKIDVLVVAKYRHSWFGGSEQGAKVLSGEIAEAEKLNRMGLNVVGLFLVKDPRDVHGLLSRLDFEHYVNIPRRYVAGFMASSKILFHPSPAESCSLMLYEGLNAGCYPVAREAGACREQLGDVGLVFNDFEDAKKQIIQVLKGDCDINVSIEQGLKFDRSSNLEVVKGELDELVM